jgi:hypothetical protein
MVRYRYPGTDHVQVMEGCRVAGVLARCHDCACDFLSRLFEERRFQLKITGTYDKIRHSLFTTSRQELNLLGV